MFQMTFTKVCRADAANFVRSCAAGGTVELWHRQLDHLNVRNIQALQSMVRGMNLWNVSSYLYIGLQSIHRG